MVSASGQSGSDSFARVQINERLVSGAKELKTSAHAEGDALIGKIDRFISQEEGSIEKSTSFKRFFQRSDKTTDTNKKNIKTLKQLKKDISSLKKDLDNTKEKDVLKIHKITGQILEKCDDVSHTLFQIDQSSSRNTIRNISAERLQRSTLQLVDIASKPPVEIPSSVTKTTLEAASQNFKETYMSQMKDIQGQIEAIQLKMEGVMTKDIANLAQDPELMKQLDSLIKKAKDLNQKMEVLKNRLEGSSSKLIELKDAPSIMFSSDVVKICSQTLDELDRIDASFDIMMGEPLTKQVQDARTTLYEWKEKLRREDCKLPPASKELFQVKINSKLHSLDDIGRGNKTRNPYKEEAEQLADAKRVVNELEKAEADWRSAQESLERAKQGMQHYEKEMPISTGPQDPLYDKNWESLCNRKAKIENDMDKAKSASDIRKIKEQCDLLENAVRLAQLEKNLERSKLPQGSKEHFQGIIDAFKAQADQLADPVQLEELENAISGWPSVTYFLEKKFDSQIQDIEFYSRPGSRDLAPSAKKKLNELRLSLLARKKEIDEDIEKAKTATDIANIKDKCERLSKDLKETFDDVQKLKVSIPKIKKAKKTKGLKLSESLAGREKTIEEALDKEGFHAYAEGLSKYQEELSQPPV